MNDVTIFRKDEFGAVRAVTLEGEPWFVAADVCRALGLGNSSMAVSKLDDDEKMTLSLTDSHSNQRGGAQMATIINEPGLYALVLSSRKPEAKAFKRWITHEVIPSIRKTGGYIAGQETMDDDQLLANALLVAQRKIAERNKQLEAANAKIQADAPKVLFAETVQKAEGDILVRQLAKLMVQRGYDTGEKRLYDLLRRDGFVIKANAKDQNAPTQRSVDMGLMRSIERTVSSADKTFISSTTLITPKGQIYFLNKYAPEKPEKKRPPVQEAMVLC
jgi:anti-repressor protein|nr:MAG TPA: repressor domain protein [Caudoviricetes sp.]